jgi:hypothetical protein
MTVRPTSAIRGWEAQLALKPRAAAISAVKGKQSNGASQVNDEALATNRILLVATDRSVLCTSAQ